LGEKVSKEKKLEEKVKKLEEKLEEKEFKEKKIRRIGRKKNR